MATLNDLRYKVLQDEPITDAEYKEVLASIRAKRTGEAAVKKAVKAKAAATEIDLFGLFDKKE